MSATAQKEKRTFSFKAPSARSVLLAGDFTRWLTHPIPLRKQGDGVWTATTTLAPGTYHYRFFVDGEWRDDPECKMRVWNQFGTQNDVIQVGAAVKESGKAAPGS
jgi:1,4-alpha-glucan branching enzyme